MILIIFTFLLDISMSSLESINSNILIILYWITNAILLHYKNILYNWGIISFAYILLRALSLRLIYPWKYSLMHKIFNFDKLQFVSVDFYFFCLPAVSTKLLLNLRIQKNWCLYFLFWVLGLHWVPILLLYWRKESTTWPNINTDYLC